MPYKDADKRRQYQRDRYAKKKIQEKERKNKEIDRINFLYMKRDNDKLTVLEHRELEGLEKKYKKILAENYSRDVDKFYEAKDRVVGGEGPGPVGPGTDAMSLLSRTQPEPPPHMKPKSLLFGRESEKTVYVDLNGNPIIPEEGEKKKGHWNFSHFEES